MKKVEQVYFESKGRETEEAREELREGRDASLTVTTAVPRGNELGQQQKAPEATKQQQREGGRGRRGNALELVH